jgi:hypothetical protein
MKACEGACGTNEKVEGSKQSVGGGNVEEKVHLKNLGL